MTKILLVEDDKSLREIYGVRLLAEGYDIVSAGDGEEALAVAGSENPDLIISDVMMPRISGFDMLDILRVNPSTRDIKVIMMTALSSEDQRKRGEMLGADKYLVKSQVGIEDVVKAAHEVLGDGQMTAEARLGLNVDIPENAVENIAEANQMNQVNSTPAPTQPAPTPTPVQPQVQPVVTPTPAPAQPVSIPQNPAPQSAMPQPAQQTQFRAPAPTLGQPVRSNPVAFDIHRPTPTQPAPTPTPVQPQVQPVVTPTPAPAQPVSIPQNPAPQSAMPQPVAPFSTDATTVSGGERVIQPVQPDTETLMREEQLAADLNSVLSGFYENGENPDSSLGQQ